MAFVQWLVKYKDACLALGALLSPFVAFTIGWFAASRQAAGALKVAELQAENARALGEAQIEAQTATAKAQIEAQTATAQQQLQATVENTKAQVRATVGIAHQQVVLDTFREHVVEISGVLHDTREVRQKVEADAKFKEKLHAVKWQLAMLVLSAPSGNHPTEFVNEVTALMNVVNSQPAGQKWSN